MEFTLSNANHFAELTLLLMLSGAQCGKCGFGTRKTSKNWARCKRCNERVPIRSMADAQAELDKRVIVEVNRRTT